MEWRLVGRWKEGEVRVMEGGGVVKWGGGMTVGYDCLPTAH